MKNTILVFLIGLFSSHAFSQNQTATLPARPKLVVGIVVDQMRWDYLYRYESKYTSGGFKRLLLEGYSCENTQIPYVPTYTAPGHTCIYTGSVPSLHGIIANNWFEKKNNTSVYCTEDSRYSTVGDTSSAGKMSPSRMLCTSIADELRLSNAMQSKCIGIAIKDRGAILPAGHSANAAYWYGGASGKWVSSDYYSKSLAPWVQHYNDSLTKNISLQAVWKTLLQMEQYHESTEDDVPWENPFRCEQKPVFTHHVEPLIAMSSDIVKALPFGNKMTFDMAKNAIKGERLGADMYTDMLTVSLSTPDYVGHQFGVNSVEIEDIYLRLDIELATFFQYLDQQVGKGNYLVFLTADHGAAHNASYLQTQKIPAGNFIEDSFNRSILNFTIQETGDTSLLLSIVNQEVYLNQEYKKNKPEKFQEFKNKLRQFIMQIPGVMNVIDLESIQSSTLPNEIRELIVNGYNAQRSGDLYILYDPAWMDGFTRGTTHGSSYRYDTHIPLVWMGWKIKPGKDYSQVYMTDIAPTLAALLRIQEPNACIGKPILGLFK